MTGGGWISFAIMALAAVVVGLVNVFTSIGASNANMPYLKSMLGGVLHFDALPPPIPTAEEKIQHELYLLSLLEGNASTGGPAGVYHSPLAAAATAGRFDFLLVLYYLALAILVLDHLLLPCVRGRARKRAQAEAESKQQDANRTLQKERAVVDSLIRENSDLKRGSNPQNVITRADRETLNDLTRENNELRQGSKDQEVITRADKEKLNGLTRENNELRQDSKDQEVITRASKEKLDDLTRENIELRQGSKDQEVIARANKEKLDDLTRENIELRRDSKDQEVVTRADKEKLDDLTRENIKLRQDSKDQEVVTRAVKAKLKDLTRENIKLRQDFKDQEVFTRADKEKLKSLTVENADLKAQVERTETELEEAKTRSSGPGETVRNLIKENNFLKKTLRSSDNQIEATEKKLNKVEKSKGDLETELAKTKNALVEANTFKSKLEDLWTKGVTDLEKELQETKTSSQNAENSKIRVVELLTKEKTELGAEFDLITTRLQRAEESNSELEKNLTQANTELKELEPLTKENTSLKISLEEATTKSERAEKSKSDLEKNLTQVNTGLKDLEPLAKENIGLKKKLEWATDTLQLAENSKSELKKNMNQTNDGLRVQLRKAKVMLKEAEDAKASELDLLAKDNADLRNQLQRIEVKRKQQEFEDARREKAETKVVEDKDEASKAFLKEISELRKKNDKLVEEMRWEKFHQNSYVARASTEAREYANRIKTLEAALGNLKEKTGLKSELQGMESEGKKPFGDVEAEIKFPKDKLEDEDEQKKVTKMWDDERDKLKPDKEDGTKQTKEGMPNQDDRELQGTIDAIPEPRSSHSPDVLALTPNATRLSGKTGPERPVALTPAQSEDSTSNTSPETLLANIQSAPLTPNNRADMPPSISTAPKPIARADALGLSMSNSTYASHNNTSKAPLVRNSVGSSVDPKNVQVKKEEKEKSRRSNRDSHSELPAASSTGRSSSTHGETHSKAEPSLEGSASYQLNHAMRYSDDNKVPTSRIEKVNRGNTNYKQSKKQQYTPTPSQPRRQDIYSSSKDEKLSSVLDKDNPRKRQDNRSWSKDKGSSNVFSKGGPRKRSPNQSGEAKVNALNNPTIQTSSFTPIPIPPENQLKEEHIKFFQTLSKQGMQTDEITAKATEAFPLLYKDRGIMGAKATDKSRVGLIDTAVGLHTVRYAKWYV